MYKFRIFLLIMVLCFCSACSNIQNTSHQTNSIKKSTAQSSPSISLSTSTPVPSFTGITGPDVLGNVIGTFINNFGEPEGTSSAKGSYFFYPPAHSKFSNGIDYLTVQIDTSDDEILKNRVVMISLNASSNSWNRETAGKICNSFAPLDANYIRLVTRTDTNSGDIFISGIDIIFSSAILARTFPSNLFIDINQKLVTPGLFDIYYMYGVDTQQFQSCQFMLGTTQT